MAENVKLRRATRTIGLTIYSIFAVAISIFIALFLFEHFFASRLENRILGEVGGAPIRELELYPFTGFHLREHHHAKGNIEPGQPYKDFNIQSADLGFFGIQFSKIPKKKPNEYRIILIGGSGAQGWGARTNKDMLETKIAYYLNDALSNCNTSVSVFNMAMGASITYQNYVALNLWGHRIEPDLILSYSGMNDYSIVTYDQFPTYYRFPELLGVLEFHRATYFPEGSLADLLAKIYPNTMTKTRLGTIAKLPYSDFYRNEAAHQYARRMRRAGLIPADGARSSEIFERVTHPLYIEALKSIKRDFEGIPMAVVFQASTSWEGENARLYDGWFSRIVPDLKGYKNDDWIFLDGHSFMRQHPDINTGMHLGNAGQDVLSRRIAEELLTHWRQAKLPLCK